MSDGIFGTDIDCSALDADTAFRLGAWIGSQLAIAEQRGAEKERERLIALLRAKERFEQAQWDKAIKDPNSHWDGWPRTPVYGDAADFLARGER